MTTHCDLCKGEIHMLMTERTRSFVGGSLTVNEIPATKCECTVDIRILLPDGVIVDGYKMQLEKIGVIGNVTIPLAKLKERFTAMDFLRPYLPQQG